MEMLISKKGVSKEEFKEFEKKTGLKLPREFKEFYSKWNGGVPKNEYFKDFQIQVFSPIKYGEYPIEEKIRLGKLDYLPEKFLPFGHSSSSESFCIDLNENNYGVIYFLPLDSEDKEFVVNNFKEFINGLKEDDNW